MNFSYWEHKTWLRDIDFAIIGSGIVGLSCALSLRRNHPSSKIVVFEKGMLPSGASTKNAGFACFGSVSEILSDLETHTEDEVVSLIDERIKGLDFLRNELGDENIDFQQHGGYEIFTLEDNSLFEKCLSNLSKINNLLKSTKFGQNDVFSIKKDPFLFKNVQNDLIFNTFEGQLDTGKMMRALIRKASENDILILNNAKIASFLDENDRVLLKMDDFEDISAKKLFVATNGFAKQVLNEDVRPARAQVLVTHPIPNLHIKGTFHLDRGYYYFRNIDNRILFGGGRNLDFDTEETMEMGLTSLVQNKLEDLLRTTILPNQTFSIDTRWSGIMGVGAQKKPILKTISTNVYCGVRLGGMGVAIGSSVGKQLANLVD